MTNKEAIEKLERHKMMNCHGCVHPSMVGWCEDHCQLPKAFDMAINALIAQDLNKQVTGKLNSADDTISRQAAIDAIRASTKKYTGFMEMEMYTDDDAVEAIINLPSAQLEQKVEELLPDGTLHLFTDTDLSKVNRVWVSQNGTHYGDLYYADEDLNCGADMRGEQDDVISRQVVVDTVHKTILGFFSDEDDVMTDTEKTLLSVNKAVCNELAKLPSVHPEVSDTYVGDIISRQDAIDALEKVAELYPWRVPGDCDSYSQYNEAWQDALNRADSEIEALPSAQTEIIRCKECVHADIFYHCDYMTTWHDGECFCSHGKRRTDGRSNQKTGCD